MSNVKKTEHGSYVSIDPDMMQKIVTAHLKEVEKVKKVVSNPVVLTSPIVRVYYKKLIEQFSADTVVLSFNEIDSQVNIQSLGMVAV
jgi:flagellar biosynthesis protein FlhA